MIRTTMLVLGRSHAAPPNAFLIAIMFVAHAPVSARADSLVIEAGQTHMLNDDVMLDGDDTLQIRGTAEKPCVLIGNRHAIRSGPKWTGSLTMTHTTIRDLGGHRQAYAPAPGSPLIGAGDPADGAGTNIGAIGSAQLSDMDCFGQFGTKE